MAKYPGDFIINEVGTRRDLARVYGVSERTIYRWLNKAAKESGLSPKAKARRPRKSTLENFKGTRKQLAKKYGVSERTAYRWLKKAREQGAQLPSRQRMSKYPGADVINNIMTSQALTNKQIAEQFGVSEQTAARWVRRARLEQPQLLPDLRKTGEYRLRRRKSENGNWVSWYEKVEPEDIGEPWEVPEPEDVGEPWEVPKPEDVGEPWEVPEPDMWEVEPPEQYTGDQDISESLARDLGYLQALLYDNELIMSDSIFTGLSYNQKIEYLNKYIEHQMEDNPDLFYNRETGEPLDASPDFVVTINIWGEQFEKWLIEQTESDLFEI